MIMMRITLLCSLLDPGMDGEVAVVRQWHHKANRRPGSGTAAKDLSVGAANQPPLRLAARMRSHWKRKPLILAVI